MGSSERKMMMKLIIFTLAAAAVVLGAPKAGDPRKFAKAPEPLGAPATYREGTLYANKNPDRLDKRSAIEGIPAVMSKKAFKESKYQQKVEKYDLNVKAERVGDMDMEMGEE